jgi:DMSO/TMAO reductase YedYZ molybdopterin-dependent catalytic subunit
VNTTTRQQSAESNHRTAVPRNHAAVAGVAAAVVALAAGELAAGLFAGLPSLVDAVGGVVIHHVPAPVKDFAIAVFGLYDKLALQVGIVAVSAAAGAALGIAAARRFATGVLGVAVFAALGLAAALVDLDARAAPLLPVTSAVVSAAGGIATLRLLLAAARPPGRAGGLHPPRPPGKETAKARPIGPQADRRQFLRMALAAVGVGTATLAAGRVLARRARDVTASTLRPLPAADHLPPPPPGADFGIPGLSPVFTPNERFYRIDTALQAPLVEPSNWSLRVVGMVERPLELSYDELLVQPLVETDVTIACVSNQVGGGLVGNARWTGIRLHDLLERAGVQPGATQIVGRSVDGFTAGFPTAVAVDRRDALVAIGMNGETLPIEHGFPARLVVPGLYGYVSATKWLADIELTTWEGFDGYWVPRGWSKQGPIKTQSRIDLPRPGRPLDAGPTVIAGVAWAPTRGVERVEVSVDDGPWLRAELADELADTTWRQWRVHWDARPGTHRLRVRATDGTGVTQTSRLTPPAPDGATGWHTVTVRVV